jgi:hypothetical protein
MALKISIGRVAAATRPPDFATQYWSDEIYHVRASSVARLFERLDIATVGNGGLFLVIGERLTTVRNVLLQAKALGVGGSLEGLCTHPEGRAEFDTREAFEAWAGEFRKKAPAYVRQFAVDRGEQVLRATAELRDAADRVFADVVEPALALPDPNEALRVRLDDETLAMARRLQRDVLLRGEPETTSILELALFALLVARDEVAVQGDRVVDLATRQFGGYAPLELGQRVRMLADLIDQRLRPELGTSA